MFPFYLKEAIQVIVLEAQAKRSKVQNNLKNSKAFQGVKKRVWKTESKSHSRFSKANKSAEER